VTHAVARDLERAIAAIEVRELADGAQSEIEVVGHAVTQRR
jgi:hypothetical protein